jgi:hypothetical protein
VLSRRIDVAPGHAPITATLLLLLTGCGGHWGREEAQVLVERVGATRITRAVESLRSLVKAQKVAVPERQWPQAIKELTPEGVYVDEDGVWVAKRSGYIEGEGLLVIFEGGKEPEEHWGDPSLWRVGKGVFWYSFTG